MYLSRASTNLWCVCLFMAMLSDVIKPQCDFKIKLRSDFSCWLTVFKAALCTCFGIQFSSIKGRAEHFVFKVLIFSSLQAFLYLPFRTTFLDFAPISSGSTLIPLDPLSSKAFSHNVSHSAPSDEFQLSLWYFPWFYFQLALPTSP